MFRVPLKKIVICLIVVCIVVTFFSHGTVHSPPSRPVTNGIHSFDRHIITQEAIQKLNAYKYSRTQKNKNASDLHYDVYIEDIFIAIKSTKAYHSKRLDLLLDTWIPQAASSVHIITDGADRRYSRIFGKEHFINTTCGATHNGLDLICKLQAMYDLFLSKQKTYKWLCSMDDDTYTLVPNLVKTLRKYNPNHDWYIGKPSLNQKYRTTEHNGQNGFQAKHISYWFATGGAGLCISRGLARKMFALTGEGRFKQRALVIENTDDTTLGYVINYLLGVNLTVEQGLHSHIEPLWEIDASDLHKQVTLSWGDMTASGGVLVENRILIRDEFLKYHRSVDNTRMLSLHCYLYPTSRQCERIVDKLGDPS